MRADATSGNVSTLMTLHDAQPGLTILGFYPSLERPIAGWTDAMPAINTSGFEEHVGEYTAMARRKPVTVTRRGQPSVVLISAEDCQRMKHNDKRATRAVAVADLLEGSLRSVRAPHKQIVISSSLS